MEGVPGTPIYCTSWHREDERCRARLRLGAVASAGVRASVTGYEPATIAMTAAKRSRGHHIVPKFYLRGFANRRKLLLVLNRSDLTRRHYATYNDAAKIKDFYTVQLDGAWSDEFEGQLSKIESLCAPVLARVLAGGNFPLNAADREAIAMMVALQFIRGQDNRRAASRLNAYMVRMMLMNTTREQLRTTIRETEGREATTEEIEKAIEFARNPTRYDVQVHKNMDVLTQMDGLHSLFGVARARSFRLLRWSKPCLLTSDSPVALTSKPNAELAFYGIGLGTADEVVLPLDRRHALVLHGRAGEDLLVDDPGPDKAWLANRRVAGNAIEQIYLHPDDGSLLDGVDLGPPQEPGTIDPAQPPRFVPDDV